MSSASNTTLKAELSVRLVVVDHYMSNPLPGLDCIYSDFRGADIKQVPILRIFGPTTDGRKACVHVHGVFPYFYVPCGTPNPDPGISYQLASSLDKALNVYLKQANSTNQHVYKISLVKGIPFYGYHRSDHLFYKIFLYNPNLLKQSVDLLQNGAVMGQTFQPYEAHLNFTLQFFIDFNLFGMSYVDFQTLSYRKKAKDSTSILLSGDSDMTFDKSIKAETMCYYEADCTACHILNRQRVGKGEGIENPGLEEVWKKENLRRKQLNLSVISKSFSQGRSVGAGTDSHAKFKELLSEKLFKKDVQSLLPGKVELDYTYPAESFEGSQLCDIGDVSIHDVSQTMEDTLVGSQVSVVDETIVQSCSLSQHPSQVSLTSEDLDLISLLQDMDKKETKRNSDVEDDNIDVDSDPDDLEYTQIFDEDKLLESIQINSQMSRDANKSQTNNSPNWDDSFWDGAAISQLDGTCDEEEHKTKRKRKLRTRIVGLSKPKKKVKEFESLLLTPKLKEDVTCIENEITAISSSRVNEETTDNIKPNNLKSISNLLDCEIVAKPGPSNRDITLQNYVQKMSSNNEKSHISQGDLVESITISSLQCDDNIANKHEKKVKETSTKLNEIENYSFFIASPKRQISLDHDNKLGSDIQIESPDSDDIIPNTDSDESINIVPNNLYKEHQKEEIDDKLLAIEDDKIVNIDSDESFCISPHKLSKNDLDVSTAYDLENKHIPQPGPSYFKNRIEKESEKEEYDDVIYIDSDDSNNAFPYNCGPLVNEEIATKVLTQVTIVDELNPNSPTSEDDKLVNLDSDESFNITPDKDLDDWNAIDSHGKTVSSPPIVDVSKKPEKLISDNFSKLDSLRQFDTKGLVSTIGDGEQIVKTDTPKICDNSIKTNCDLPDKEIASSKTDNGSVIKSPTHEDDKLANIDSDESFHLAQNKYSDFDYYSNESDSSHENEIKRTGIKSFYDVSKFFDTSSSESDKSLSAGIDDSNKLHSVNENDKSELNIKKESPKEFGPTYEDDFHLKYSPSDASDNSVSETPPRRVILVQKFRPPTRADVLNTLDKYGIPKVKNRKPFYSDYKDAGGKIEVGDMLLKIKSDKSIHQKPFESVLSGLKPLEEWRADIFKSLSGLTDEDANAVGDLKLILASNRRCILEPLKKAPTTSEVKDFVKSMKADNKDLCKDFTPDYCDDIEEEETIGLNEKTLTPDSLMLTSKVEENKSHLDQSVHTSMSTDGSFICFGNVPSQQETVLDLGNVEHDFLTIMILEVHSACRKHMLSDPSVDKMQAVFYSITNDVPENHAIPKSLTEIVVVDDGNKEHLNRCGLKCTVKFVSSEMELIDYLFDVVKVNDPDLICGYDVEMNSWGYFLERCLVLGVEVLPKISRVTEPKRQKTWKSDTNDYEGRIIGRVIFNVWRLFRKELALSSYSFESTMYHILKERVPSYTCDQLNEWWSHESKTLRWLPVEYYLTRLSGTLRMMQSLDLINRTSELARLFGLQWWEVMSRGSQFRVESLMLRAARPLNLVALSPSVRQRAAMKAPEILPLIFEPESRFYSDPVIVLDFQSLYPSMMIAYNYCFSTCIGNIRNINGETPFEFGAWRLRIQRSKLENLSKHDLINWSPIGAGFVKPEVRRGVLPALLRRILAARQAVKKNMKTQKDEAVKRAMHSRQLGLKLIANVTYGYTAANFSGRMPCVELGDSVVSKGRETLERAIQLVKSNKEWNVKVVYGDTDSLFVLVPGADRAKAFQIGQEIADAVTADNPSPVLLKLEKVYQPCILQTKKRYVGFMYETADQKDPVYEAKGIETVRRDGCPAGVKLLQNSLCELFTSYDMSRVKRLVCKVLSDLSDGRMPIHELFMTREYNGPGGYKPGAAAPPLEIARRMSSRDPRSVPSRGWRVAWLVSAGAPQTPLVKLARTPLEAARENCRPFALYYITRVLLPPLARCMSLVGQDVFQWYHELPRRTESGAGGIVAYMQRGACAVCGVRGTGTLCKVCAGKPQKSLAELSIALREHTQAVQFCRYVCMNCTGHSEYKLCVDVECPVMWRRLNADTKLTQTYDNFRGLPPRLVDERALDF